MTLLDRDVDSPAAREGARCGACGAPVASDQRYCLNCGEPWLPPRVPLDQLGRAAAPQPASTVTSEAPPSRPWSNIGLAPLAAGLGLVLLAVLLGVVIGHGGRSEVAVPASAGAPQVITVATGGGATTGSSASAFKGDWPSGKTGYTVQLQSLPKDGTEASAVATAKSDAEAKGAGDVGALDSDGFDGLPAASYIVYSGVFDTKAQAKKALAKLKGDFGGAKVVKVVPAGGGGSAKTVDKGALKELESASPNDYSKKSRKLPDKLKTEGKPPPKDNKKPGGGGDVETIGG